MVLGPAWAMASNIKDDQESIAQFVKDLVLHNDSELPPKTEHYQIRRMKYKAIIYICSKLTYCFVIYKLSLQVTHEGTQGKENWSSHIRTLLILYDAAKQHQFSTMNLMSSFVKYVETRRIHLLIFSPF